MEFRRIISPSLDPCLLSLNFKKAVLRSKENHLENLKIKINLIMLPTLTKCLQIIP